MYGGRIDIDQDLLQKLARDIKSLKTKEKNARNVDERKKYNYHLRLAQKKRNEIWRKMEDLSRTN